jgi:hypothetical protein
MPGSGESIIEPGHFPFLQTPGDFTLTQAVSGAGQVTLSWSQSSHASSYQVEYGTSTGAYTDVASMCVAASTKCVVTGLSVGVPYYFKVTASNTLGSLVAGNELSATPIGAFSLSGVTASSGQVSVSFALATGATSYTVRYGLASGFYPFTFSTSATSSPVVVTGLSNGTNYYFQMVATNSSGSVTSTNELSAMPLGVPAAPASLSATSSPGIVYLTWSASAGGGVGYIVRRATAAGGPYTDIATGISTTNYVDSTVTTADPYYYTVVATSGGGTSGNSNEIAVTSIQSFVVSSFSVTSSSTVINWPGAVSGAANYTVKQSLTVGQSYLGTSVTGCVNTSATTCTISGLTAGTTYYFTVVAQNAGTGSIATSNSNEIAATPLLTPFTSVISGTGQVVFQWSAVSLATGYSIKYSNSPGQAATSGAALTGCTGLGSSAVTCTGTGLTNGSQYYFAIVASLSSGGTYTSNEVMGLPIASFTIGTISLVNADSAQVAWNSALGA